MIKTILTATDGSDHSRKAVELACDLAAKYNAKLILLNVADSGAVSAEMRRLAEAEHLVEPTKQHAVFGPAVQQALTALDDAGYDDAALHKACHTIGRQIVERAQVVAHEKGVKDVETTVEIGDPASEILEAAKKAKVDFIVMGARGLGGLEGLLLGSISHKVSHLAECTCVTVK